MKVNSLCSGMPLKLIVIVLHSVLQFQSSNIHSTYSYDCMVRVVTRQ